MADFNDLEEVNKGGRPPIYETVEELVDRINEYFLVGRKSRKVLIGRAPNQTMVEMPVVTVSGLAIYLGFASRQSFYDYEKTDKFSYTIKRARLFIEEEYEEQLQHGNVTGAIFALKNLGWKDKTEVDLTATVTSKSEQVAISLVDEALGRADD